MKIIGLYIASCMLFCSVVANAQGVAINTTGAAADNSAMLDVNSTTQGMLAPRMDSAQRSVISNPATGLLVYQTNGVTPGFYFYNGSVWKSLTVPANITTQGNTFNGATQLVQTNASSLIPVANLGSSSGTATTYLNGTGAFSTPAGGGSAPIIGVAPSVSTTGTYSFPISGGTGIAASTVSEVYEEAPVPAACTLKNLYARIVSGGAAYQVSITLYKNGSATSVTCSTGTTAASLGASASCTDLTHTVSAAAGDTFAWVVQPNISNNSCRVSAAVVCQ